MGDERIPPFLFHACLGAFVLYSLLASTHCGEDECIDRPVVATITAAFWLVGATVLARTRGRDRSRAAIRWAAATLWLVAAAAFLLILTFFAYDVVFDY